MDDALTVFASIEVVRARLANAVLGPSFHVDARLGAIRLRDRQRALAGRILRLIELHRGALLADPVGLGKTYTALAVARGFERLVVVSPASLRAMWTDACARAATPCSLVTHEGLSRGMPVGLRVDAKTLIVVDEAHRFRNPATLRYARLTALSRAARLLLVTATPIQNRLEDLAAPLALFVGAEAFALSGGSLARYVVRGTVDPASEKLPSIVGPTRVRVDVAPAILDAILRLPPPLPASDEGVAAALVAQLLVRRWTSSQAALQESVRRLLAKTLALRDSTLAGRRVTRADLGLWEFADDSVQLAFPALLGDTTCGEDPGDTHVALETHAEALRALLRSLSHLPDSDAARARALLEIRRRHPGERVVAFSQYARTVDALFARASASGGVAALTANGARIANGRITRGESMEQFTPDGGRPSMKAAPIELLLATDLLSEGLNLQRASVVVHLDLPWNPARLDQRVGRVRRMGSLHDSVAVYIMDPVGAGGAVRQVEERLRAKLRIARDTIGAADGILPRDSPASDATSRTGAAEALGEIQRVLERWQDVGAATTPAGADAPILVAAVRASARGWLCAYDSGTDPRLLAEIDGRVGDDTLHIQAALDHGAGSQVNADPSHVRECVEAARGWIAGRRAARAVDLRAGLTSRIRRDLLSRLAHVVARSPRHRRAAVTRSAELARRAVTMPLGLGAEQALHELVATAQSDHEWLAAVAAFAEANGQQPGGDAARDDGVIAMVVFGGPARSDNA